MKYIYAKKDFTLNHDGMTHYKGQQYYEVNSDVADHWWTQSHCTILGVSNTPDAPEGEHVRGPTGAPHTPWKDAPTHVREAKPLGYNPMVPRSTPAPEPAPKPAPVKKGTLIK